MTYATVIGCSQPVSSTPPIDPTSPAVGKADDGTAMPASAAAWATLRDDMRACIPPSIMAHSADHRRFPGLLRVLDELGYRTITYRDYAAILEGQAPRPRKPVIISVDDIGSSWVRPEFHNIVGHLQAAGAVASMAVNPHALHPGQTGEDLCKTDSGYNRDLDLLAPQIRSMHWRAISDWQALGISDESHTVDHVNLSAIGSMNAVSRERRLRCQIEGASTRIEAGTGTPPVALILPFGLPMSYEPATGLPESTFETIRSYVRDRTELRFLVGIADGGHRRLAVDAEGAIDYPVSVGRVNISTGASAPEQYDGVLAAIKSWYSHEATCDNVAGAMIAELGAIGDASSPEATSSDENRARALVEAWNAWDETAIDAAYAEQAELISPTAEHRGTPGTGVPSQPSIAAFYAANLPAGWCFEVRFSAIDGNAVRVGWQARRDDACEGAGTPPASSGMNPDAGMISSADGGNDFDAASDTGISTQDSSLPEAPDGGVPVIDAAENEAAGGAPADASFTDLETAHADPACNAVHGEDWMIFDGPRIVRHLTSLDRTRFPAPCL